MWNLTALDSRDFPSIVYGTNGAVVVQETPNDTGVAQLLSFVPFDGYSGPLSVAAVDQRWVAVGAGPGGGPRAQLWRRGASVYEKVYDAFVYEPSFRGGVNVGLCDWNGDGTFDLLVGAGVGGGPRLRALDGGDRHVLADFFAFESSFRGGVYVDAYRREAVVVPGPGGGPRVRKFDAGVQVADQFVSDPTSRSITDYAYGMINNEVRLCALDDGGRTVRTYHADLTPDRVTPLYHAFGQLGVGDYFNFDQTNLVGTDRGAIVTLDEVFGIPLGHADQPRDVQVGSYQNVGVFHGPPTLPPIIPLAAKSVYQEVTGDPTVFPGRSIGSPFGTLTYTATVTDATTGAKLGLSNYHGFNGLVPVVTPGRADALEPDRFPLGQVVRLDRAHDADWAVFTVTQPTDDRVRIGFYDGFLDSWRVTIWPPFRYDPAVTAELGVSEYHVGRTTATQRAVCYGLGVNVVVGYPDADVLQHGQTVYSGYGFSRPGDSGSPVFRVVGGALYLTGQLFAGDGNANTIVTPIGRVLAQAGVTLP